MEQKNETIDMVVEPSESKELAVVQETPRDLSLRQNTPAEVKAQMEAMQELMRSVMTEGIDGDYGVIPGTGGKPTLLKPGAEKICQLFQARPEYEEVVVDLPDGHREWRHKCTLYHIGSDKRVGQGVGMCSTMESKYRYRKAVGESTGEAVPRAYWDLRKDDPKAAQKLLGAGMSAKKNKENGRWEIHKQSDEKVDNPNIADEYNTVLKMAKKRAYVDAALTLGAASALFTQDMDDHAKSETQTEQRKPPKQGGGQKKWHRPKSDTSPPSDPGPPAHEDPRGSDYNASEYDPDLRDENGDPIPPPPLDLKPSKQSFTSVNGEGKQSPQKPSRDDLKSMVQRVVALDAKNGNRNAIDTTLRIMNDCGFEKSEDIDIDCFDKIMAEIRL